MHIQYFKEYSYSLDRDMEFKVYGHAGVPFVVFPCQDGNFYDFEDRGMVNLVSDHINAGRMQMICISSIDKETWSAKGEHHGRIMWHEQWFNYVCNEFMPRLYEIRQGLNDPNWDTKPILTGASMGGYHCVNFYLRRPDLFGGCLSLSGLFHASYFFPNYTDVNVYYNSPNDFMRNMSIDHPLIEEYRKGKIVICCGQGAWEDEAKVDARGLDAEFKRLGVDAWVDLWGEDVNHDWPWWYKQFPYHVERLLERC